MGEKARAVKLALVTRCCLKRSNLATRREYSIQSVVRSFNIVQEVADAGDEIGAQEISSALRLHISTVFRFLQTLVNNGLVERNPHNGKYRLGMKLLDWGMQVLRQMDLRRDALPYLRELSENTRQTVHMTVYDRGAAIYVEKIQGPTALRGYSEIGKAAPLHCTGVGKALMAALSPAELSELLKTYQVRRFTPNTITNTGTLRKEMERIRSQGYALDNEEHEPGIRCVAAPIRNHTGKVVASISIAGRTTDITPDRIPRLIQAVKETAQKIGARLGHGSAAEEEPGSDDGRYASGRRAMIARQK